jgi:hypothetical protein
MMLPKYIPEESEKLDLITPVWKIQLVKESLKYMMTDEDAGLPANSEDGSPARERFSSPGVTNFNYDSETEGSPARSSPFGKKSSLKSGSPGPKQNAVMQVVARSLVQLVNHADSLSHDESISYLKRIIDAQKRVG